MRGDHRLFICAGYEPATDRLRVLFPDCIEFPVLSPWVSFIDQRHLRFSPNRHAGADRYNFRRNESRPGAREALIHAPRGLGQHFTSTRVNYRLDGADFILELPDEDDRRPPRAYGRRQVKLPPPRPHIEAVISHVPIIPPPVAERFDQESVTLSGHGSTWRYSMSPEQLLAVTAIINEYLHQSG
jgi:hypothetical protein